MKKSIILVSFFLAMVLFTGCSKPLTAEENYAIQNTQNLKDRLKDPDSFKLHEDILVVTYGRKNATQFYTYIDYGAKNGFGGMTRDTAMFSEYTYVGTVKDADTKYNSGNIEPELGMAYVPYVGYMASLGGYDVGDELQYIFIDKDTVLKNLK